MKALGSSLGCWRSMEGLSGCKGRHGIAAPLATVAAIGAPYGLEIIPEEEHRGSVRKLNAVLVSVLDSRLLLDAQRYFNRWHLPMRRSDRQLGKHPLVIAGGQGLHNPMPMAEIADLIVIGDAEEPLPALLDLWRQHGASRAFLEEAARVSGVYVPGVHRPGRDQVRQSVSRDVSISLRVPIEVNLDGTRRLEVARGCRHKCPNCGLGWRAPLRLNDTSEILTALAQSGAQVNLCAGNAVDHPGYPQLVAAMRKRGQTDGAWTGRLDSLRRVSAIEPRKRYAIGIESGSEAVRKALLKGYLTDEYLITRTAHLLDSIDGDGPGRTAWHLMAGLPGERLADHMHIRELIRRIGQARHRRMRRAIAVHWQPFSPLPGTPMQWCGAGRGARMGAGIVGECLETTNLHVYHETGRTDRLAAICTILARADGPGGLRLLEAIHRDEGLPIGVAAELAGTTSGPIPVDRELPWDWITYHWPRRALEKAHTRVLRVLREAGRYDPR